MVYYAFDCVVRAVVDGHHTALIILLWLYDHLESADGDHLYILCFVYDVSELMFRENF